MTTVSDPPTVQRPPAIPTRWLDRAPSAVFAAWSIAAAFGTYFCMYAFRKPFAAATFDGERVFGLGFKDVLVAAQLVGYTASKFLGLRFVAPLAPRWRAAAILALIGAAEVALVGFALAPKPWAPLFLALNGLPLGMVFGLVLLFLEGRRTTELLTAGLCASFILAGGAAKSLGRALIEVEGVDPRWMPAVAGALFVVPLLVCVWMLTQIPPPRASDIEERHARVPMDRSLRRAMLRRHLPTLLAFSGIYALITVVRTVRDDFGVEVWRELGVTGEPGVFARSELFVMLAVLVLAGSTYRIRSHRAAVAVSVLSVPAGFAVVGGAFALERAGAIGAFPFMVAVGFGLYVPYVLFHTTVFERFLAVTRDAGNLSFLMFLADAAGYLTVVFLLFGRGWTASLVERTSYLPLFGGVSLVAGTLGSALALATLWRLQRTRAALGQ